MLMFVSGRYFKARGLLIRGDSGTEKGRNFPGEGDRLWTYLSLRELR